LIAFRRGHTESRPQNEQAKRPNMQQSRRPAMGGR
jgi:hypothetical protein